MLKNKLFISSFESCTEYGFVSKSIADTMISKQDCIIRNLPDFDALNEYDDVLSPLKHEKSQHIDTIIQYVPSDYVEYHFNYKNILIPNVKHFLKRNKSILDKLSLADELWVFDDQQKEFLGDNLADKVVIVGYPYSKNRIANLFNNKQKTQNSNINFYCITDITNIENLEILIYNFILIFHKTYNVNLYLYIKQFAGNTEQTDNLLGALFDKIRNQFRFIDKETINSMVTILSGNYYIDNEAYIDLHTKGDCYINIDYNINPDIFTASYLGKYMLSIINIKNTIEYNSNYIVETTPANHRISFDNANYFNEFNSYPRINDISMQNRLITVYNDIKSGNNSKNCYASFDENGMFK